MACVVTDADGRREFRWLQDGRRRSRRVPRGGQGDRVLSDLRAAHDAGADAAGRPMDTAGQAPCDNRLRRRDRVTPVNAGSSCPDGDERGIHGTRHCATE